MHHAVCHQQLSFLLKSAIALLMCSCSFDAVNKISIVKANSAALLNFCSAQKTDVRINQLIVCEFPGWNYWILSVTNLIKIYQ